jgi:hypothetical protein
MKRSLNESADDFVDAVPAKQTSKKSKPTQSSQVPKRKETKVEEESVVAVEVQSDVAGLPDCPICGKVFPNPKHQTQRVSHLKSCGASKGLTAEQLVKVRQLEERQAEERKAIGLPMVPPKNAAGLNSETRKGSNSSRNATRSRKPSFAGVEQVRYNT